MSRVVLLLLLIVTVGIPPLQAKKQDYLSVCRVSPILPESVENVLLKASAAKVVYFNTDSTTSRDKKLLDYGYALKKTVKTYRYTMLSAALLSKNSFIKSDYSVLAPFVPQTGILIDVGSTSVVFLFSFQNSTVRVFENGIKVEELLINDPNSILFLFKLFLN